MTAKRKARKQVVTECCDVPVFNERYCPKCGYEARIKPAIPPTLRRLNAEMRFLERMVVEVRLPLVYGSRHLFTASPTSVEGRGDEPSDLRKQIAAYLAAQKRKR